MKQKLRVFLTLLLCAVASVGWGDESTLTFTAACNGSGTADDDVEWTITSDAAESTYDSTKGIHYGTSKVAVSYLNLSTSGIPGTITSITVNASGASGTTAVLNVSVGGSSFGTEQSLTATATEYTLTGTGSGEIVVSVTQSSTKKALYVKSVKVTYTTGTVTPIVKLPVLNPSTGSYTSAPNVEITCETEGATIYYTKNGEDPTTSSSVYRDPITITLSGTTLKAMAAKEGMDNSPIVSATYTIQPDKPTISIDNGAVTISAEDGLSIYYTINGDDPTTESASYTGTFSLEESCTVKAIAVDEYGNVSQIASEKYVNNNVFAKNLNTYYYKKVTNVSELENGDAVLIANEESRYVMSTEQKNNNRGAYGLSPSEINDGVIDKENSNIQRLTLVKEGDYWYFYTGSGYLYAASSSGNYLRTKEEKDDNAKAAISISNGNASVVFQGTNTRNVMQYNSQLFACYASASQKPIQLYVEVERPSVAAPTFSVEEGIYDADQTVEISCKAESATIYYTLDGSEPTNESMEYTTAITITETTTIKAVAYLGDQKSNVSSVTITINKPATAANIAAFKEFESGTANITLTLTDAQVLYVSGKDMYVQDASGAINFYDLGLDFEAGDVINGTIKGSYTYYNGMPELTAMSVNTLEKTGTTTIVPTEINAEEISNYSCQLVTIKNQTVSTSNNRFYVGNGNIQLYNKYYKFSVAEDDVIDVTGIAIYYKTNSVDTWEIAPRSADDITTYINTTISAAGYATFANAKAVDFTGTGVIVMTAQYANGKITYTEVTSKQVPAGEPVILQGNQGTYNATVIASAAALENNNLQVDLEKNQTSDGTYYCLANKSKGVGFYKVANGTIVKQGKAYLVIPAEAKDFFSINDETDGIGQIEMGQTSNAEIYNLSGQRVNKAQKGVYIVNGKKVVVK
jgi:hypothetical protein